ncbi:MAG: HmuY family protein [Proteobacteria bacterium]|nr:HmuY family protein [Pseudomonadota bacterium]
MLSTCCVLFAAVTGCDDSVELCSTTAVQCIDDAVSDLSLHSDKISAGTVTNSEESGDFVSVIDATAGGAMEAANNAYLYMKFTNSGLTKVEIDDETALESQDWHIAARRYVIRLNGGASGPSCVGAAFVDGMGYADVNEVPSGATFITDGYYDGKCTLVLDGSGVPGSPKVALTGWWDYTVRCVQMTMKPAVIELDDGRYLKLIVESYYETDQDVCNNTGLGGKTSGIIKARWRFLDRGQER